MNASPVLAGALPVTVAHTVRPSDLDSLGHVNNARSLEYFELGRHAWLKANAIPYSTRCVAVVRGAELKFLREIGMEGILITTEVVKEGFYEVVFEQRILLAESGLAAVSGKIFVAVLDREARRPRRIRDFLAGEVRLLAQNREGESR
jgi:acyl-CoA thioesterase FadM